MENLLNFLAHFQDVIYLLITLGGWVVFLYNQGKKPEQKQNARIDEIYQMTLDLKEEFAKMRDERLGEIKATVELLIRREFNRMCMTSIEKGYCTMADLDQIENMYYEYHHKYHMNGKGEELYKRVHDLELRGNEDYE